MQKIFVTSDIWFNRPIGKMSEYSTNDYNDTIVNNWNKTVGKKDIVYILGGLGISDIYPIIVKLNGELHILNNFFSKDEEYFYTVLKQCIQLSVDKKLKNRIIFENSQIISIPEHDIIFSYFPLSTWGGAETGTYCFHGYDEKSDLTKNKISCKLEDWNYKPISITEIKNSIQRFKNNL